MLKVSLVVGMLLSIINQGGTVVDGLQLSWVQVGMNYIVPYCLACYRAARNEKRRHKRRQKAFLAKDRVEEPPMVWHGTRYCLNSQCYPNVGPQADR